MLLAKALDEHRAVELDEENFNKIKENKKEFPKFPKEENNEEMNKTKIIIYLPPPPLKYPQVLEKTLRKKGEKGEGLEQQRRRRPNPQLMLFNSQVPFIVPNDANNQNDFASKLLGQLFPLNGGGENNNKPVSPRMAAAPLAGSPFDLFSNGGGLAAAGQSATPNPLLQMLTQGSTLEQITTLTRNLLQMSNGNKEILSTLMNAITGGGGSQASKLTSSALATASLQKQPQLQNNAISAFLAGNKSLIPSAVIIEDEEVLGLNRSNNGRFLEREEIREIASNGTITSFNGFTPEQRKLLAAAVLNGELDPEQAVRLLTSENITTANETISELNKTNIDNSLFDYEEQQQQTFFGTKQKQNQHLINAETEREEEDEEEDEKIIIAANITSNSTKRDRRNLYNEIFDNITEEDNDNFTRLVSYDTQQDDIEFKENKLEEKIILNNSTSLPINLEAKNVSFENQSFASSFIKNDNFASPNEEKIIIKNLKSTQYQQTLLLTLPPERLTKLLDWLAVWEHEENKEALAVVLIPKGLQIPSIVQIRAFPSPAIGINGVKMLQSGPIKVLDTKTIEVTEFTFLSDNLPAWFMVGKEIMPNAKGHIVPIFDKTNKSFNCDSLREYHNETVKL
uniref:DM13 domain-containing protein n=1 Tax=Meloidogyne javanica TaxID=6303 RepID=A0A915N518_MELJA